MEANETLKIIVDKFNLDLSQPNPIQIKGSRWHELGPLLNDLKFTKGAEIGVYRGRFTATLGKQCPNLQLSAIDAWTSYTGYIDYEKNDLEVDAYVDTVRRTKDMPNVKLIKGWSSEVVKQFEDESLDYIFIDANHDYASVVEDINLWSKKVKKGGIVMGHDYFVMRKLNFGVIQAVNGWVETNHIKHLFTWRDNCPSWLYDKGDTL